MKWILVQKIKIFYCPKIHFFLEEFRKIEDILEKFKTISNNNFKIFNFCGAALQIQRNFWYRELSTLEIYQQPQIFSKIQTEIPKWTFKILFQNLQKIEEICVWIQDQQKLRSVFHQEWKKMKLICKTLRVGRKMKKFSQFLNKNLRFFE